MIAIFLSDQYQSRTSHTSCTASDYSAVSVNVLTVVTRANNVLCVQHDTFMLCAGDQITTVKVDDIDFCWCMLSTPVYIMCVP